MKIRRFFAPDMRRAIQLVRTEHGADAVILSSRAVNGGMEIVSAVDYDEELISLMVQPGGAAGRDDAAAVAAVGTGAPVTSVGAAAPVVSAMHAGASAAAASAVSTHDAGVVAQEEVAAADQSSMPAPEALAPGKRPRRTLAATIDELLSAATASKRASSEPVAEPATTPAPKPAAETDRRVDVDARARARAIIESDRSQTGRRTSKSATSAAEDPSIAALRAELLAMKSLLSREFARLRSDDQRVGQPDRAVLASRVARLGLDADLEDALVGEIENPGGERAWREVMFGLARRLRVPKDDPLDAGGVIALVGPTGVGKTTTIAKLAARHCLRYGAESLALISTDTLRVGAQRQLDAFGAILGVPVRQAAGATELGRLLRSLRDRRLVLVDTAGMSARDRRLSDALGQLDADRRLRKLIVLAANMQAGAMDEAVRAFGGSRLAGAVITKLDEAVGLGPVLSVLIRRKLQAVWLSNGQRVPEDLRLARIIHLLKWAVDEPWAAREPDTAALHAVPAARTSEVAHADA